MANTNPDSEPLRVAVFASGAGTTFAALADGLSRHAGAAEVVLLIVSRAGAGAGARAAERGIECAVLDQREIGAQRVDQEMLALLQARTVGLVVLAGYLSKIGPRTLEAFPGQIINTHPAPLPRFGGQGMFGTHVHQAVLDSGVTMSAATVHLVDAEYDTGPTIARRPVPVLPGDDVSSLRDRVQRVERKLLIESVLGLCPQ